MIHLKNEYYEKENIWNKIYNTFSKFTFINKKIIIMMVILNIQKII